MGMVYCRLINCYMYILETHICNKLSKVFCVYILMFIRKIFNIKGRTMFALVNVEKGRSVSPWLYIQAFHFATCQNLCKFGGISEVDMNFS